MSARPDDIPDEHRYGFQRESASTREQKRVLIDSHIKPIVAMAKIVLRDNAELRQGTGSDATRTYEGALFVADTLAQRVEPIKARFVEAGMLQNFVDALRAPQTR